MKRDKLTENDYDNDIINGIINFKPKLRTS